MCLHRLLRLILSLSLSPTPNIYYFISFEFFFILFLFFSFSNGCRLFANSVPSQTLLRRRKRWGWSRGKEGDSYRILLDSQASLTSEFSRVRHLREKSAPFADGVFDFRILGDSPRGGRGGGRKREREREREKNEKEKKKKKKTGVIRDCVNLLSGIIIHEQQPGRGDGKRRRNVQSPLL